ncbi:putative ion transporter superfamily protein YfcC [Planomicrobium stackebrandtii]|uniref:Ion transporter superfamily protein YfcC n=1 Tax=Planomicrobium stackebrandtii TaxID=253160 RepID=A0ABU0GWW0_9BACL|nr:YfcC family protein [Planomicrobium stackebrandtii]MDQ0429837.1 putative ion transporter superfamily protein YfcC [Planomicrobium stackebrandtii]
MSVPNNQKEAELKKKKKFEMPDTYVILFIVLLMAVAATYIVPAGSFEREMVDEVERVVPNTYAQTDSNPTGFMDIFLALQAGMVESGGLIFLVLFAGGAFEVVERSGAIKGGILRAVNKTKGKEFLLIALVSILFALGGAVGAVANSIIPFVAIGVIIARALKLDAIVAVAITFGATFAGFNVGFLNPYTVGIAQSIADVPLFSGMGLRVIAFVVIVGVTILYTWSYAKKVLADPSKSLIGVLDEGAKDESPLDAPFTTRHKLILSFVGLCLAFFVYATIEFQWTIDHMAAFFIIIGIGAGIIAGMDYNKLTLTFLEGCKNLVYGALIIGVARAILIVMENALILDTFVQALSVPLAGLSPVFAALGMFVANGALNFLVPSGSGQAMIVMPILAPLSDMIGVTRQVAVQAYQFGDGFTNSIFPTSGPLMASLAVAGVPWIKWAKWMLPLLLMWVVIAVVMLTFAVLINWGPV